MGSDSGASAASPEESDVMVDAGYWYWLSFLDTTLPYVEEEDYPGGPRHSGVCIVYAPTFELAIGAADVHGCNPGGQVAGWMFPPGTKVPFERAFRLFTGDDVETVSKETVAWVEERM